ncbi:MAG: hypothetical protein CBC34_013590 [Hyphomicrobiaceae bacterium TMED74]|nr:hypothetical protein [Filomicrobium sp.]RPG39886.1 MAG: hypothetical protein CBC34_013590 [Hyphomicrobiaceae bacterium TMED74]
MTKQVTSSLWGAGIVASRPDGHFEIKPHPAEPDPSRINENIGGALRSAARIQRPSIQKSYLEGEPGTCGGERGAEPFIKVE